MDDRRSRVREITLTSLLAAASTVLFFFSFPLPFFPPFVKMDFSNVPALVAAFVIGPWAGAAVELIKNLINLMRTSTGGVGELAAFLIGCAYVIPAGALYRAGRSTIVSLAVGTLLSVITAALANYLILIPLYSKFFPMEALIAMYSAAIPIADTLPKVILFSVVPFNIIKCALVAAVTQIAARRILKK